MNTNDEKFNTRNELYKLFAQKIEKIFNVDDFVKEYNENQIIPINYFENHSELHVDFGESVVVIFNFWEKDSKSLDIIYENGQWILEPNEYWKEYDKAIEVDGQFIEEILEKFKLKANESLESRT